MQPASRTELLHILLLHVPLVDWRSTVPDTGVLAGPLPFTVAADAVTLYVFPLDNPFIVILSMCPGTSNVL